MCDYDWVDLWAQISIYKHYMVQVSLYTVGGRIYKMVTIWYATILIEKYMYLCMYDGNIEAHIHRAKNKYKTASTSSRLVYVCMCVWNIKRQTDGRIMNSTSCGRKAL